MLDLLVERPHKYGKELGSEGRNGMAKNKIIKVQNIPITISFNDKEDFICITDIAAAKT